MNKKRHNNLLMKFICNFFVEGLVNKKNFNVKRRVEIVSHAVKCDIDDSCEKVKFL